MFRIILAAWAVVALIVIGGVAGFFGYTHLVLGIGLENQPGSLRLPPQLKVRAQATRKVAIGLDGRVKARVPVHQTLSVPLHGRYKANLKLHAHTPLHFVIDYQAKVLIHGSATVQGTTRLVVHSKLIPSFPLKVKVPLDFDLPVHLEVPVNTMFDLDYVGPVVIRINQAVHARVDTVLNTHLDVDRSVEAPITSAFGMLLKPPQTPLPVLVSGKGVKLPLRGLQLTVAH